MPQLEALDSSLGELAARLRGSELDVTTLIEGTCDRLEERNPRLLAMLPETGRRERLLMEARALEARFAPSARPPLFGVPVAVKDVIRVDGLPTRAGSALPAEVFAGSEAWVVTRLREAGALILGKSATTEFAYFEPAATRNPRAPGHTPGGSSSGSAAAVAGGLSPLALGTQTVGSVIRPAAYCGVAAFKPSLGRVPSIGIVYYAPSVDTVGWFARDVGGLIEAARVLIEGWREPAPASRVVLGVPDGPYLAQAEPAGTQAFERTLEVLVRRGVEVRRVPALDDITAINERHGWLTAAEFAEQHRELFAAYGPLYRPRSAQLFDEGSAVTSEQRAAGLAGTLALRDDLEALMAVHGVSAWVSPSAPGPAPLGQASTGSPAMNTPWTHAGLPVVTVPAGDIEGLPLGLQLAGRHGFDEALLEVARAVESALAT